MFSDQGSLPDHNIICPHMNQKESLGQDSSFSSKHAISKVASAISPFMGDYLSSLCVSLIQSGMKSKNTVVIKPCSGTDPAIIPP